ncbi:hypothetical protein JCM17960_05540 [Magnetospira thiophila]
MKSLVDETAPTVSLEFIEALLEAARHPLVVLSNDMCVIRANQKFYRSFQETPEGTEGRRLSALGNGLWDFPGLQQLTEQVGLPNDPPLTLEVERDIPSLGVQTFLISGRKFRGSDAPHAMTLLTIENITERSRVEDETREATEFTKAILETVREPLVILDDELRVIRASRNFYRFIQMSPKEALGLELGALGNGQLSDPELMKSLLRVIPHRATIDALEVQHEFPPGKLKTLLFNARQVRLSSKQSPAILLGIEDITARKTLDEEIQRLALTDPLTGLANRNRFETALDDAIKFGRRFKFQAALLLLDLDKFKMVNDTYGHPVGDELLCVVASLLSDGLRAVDTVARLGGDEFGVILEGISHRRDAEHLAQQYVEKLCVPFDIDGQSISIGVSVGIAHFPDDADDAAELNRRADLALYLAKEEGRGTYRAYTPALEDEIHKNR